MEGVFDGLFLRADPLEEAHLVGVERAHEVGQHLLGLAAPHHEVAAQVAQRAAQVDQALEEEARAVGAHLGEAEHALARVAWVEAVDGHDAVGGLEGVGQRFVVVHAQVVAEPDEGSLGHAARTLGVWDVERVGV